jgi:hypothetical protein
MGADKNSSRMMNSTHAPNSQPRVPTRVCQGHIVTTYLPTLGTNPNSKQHGSATQEAKDLGNLRSPKQTVRGDQVDSPRGGGGRSAGQGRTVRKWKPNLHCAPSKNRTIASSLRTVRSSRPHRADGPANTFQPKPTGQTDREEATQELAKTTNTWLKSSSRTVCLPPTDGPPITGVAVRA